MRVLPYHGLTYCTLLLCVPLFLIQGCSRTVLQTYPASEQEFALVTEAFTHYQAVITELCGCCLDAEIDVSLSVSGWFSDHTGNLTGYLQAMEPGFMKFISVNPLGQPLFIFATNGNIFKSFDIFAQKAYAGSVHSNAYKKFAPPGFDPGFSYYWLTGRLQPGNIRIMAVMRDREQDAFWLQIDHADSGMGSMVLFDPEDKVILRHVLRDDRDAHLVDVIYKEHQLLPERESGLTDSGPAAVPYSPAESDGCRVPARIMVSSKGGSEQVEIKLHSMLRDIHFSAVDFQIEAPDNFEQLLVE